MSTNKLIPSCSENIPELKIYEKLVRSETNSGHSPIDYEGENPKARWQMVQVLGIEESESTQDGLNHIKILMLVKNKASGKILFCKGKTLTTHREEKTYGTLKKEALLNQYATQIPEVIKVQNYVESNDIGYLITEYLDPKDWDLADNINNLSHADALRICRILGDAIKRINELGLIHLDIHPKNYFISKQRDKVKIIDFGIAQAVEDHAKQELYLQDTDHPRSRRDITAIGQAFYDLTKEGPNKASSYNVRSRITGATVDDILESLTKEIAKNSNLK